MKVIMSPEKRKQLQRIFKKLKTEAEQVRAMAFADPDVIIVVIPNTGKAFAPMLHGMNLLGESGKGLAFPTYIQAYHCATETKLQMVTALVAQEQLEATQAKADGNEANITSPEPVC